MRTKLFYLSAFTMLLTLTSMTMVPSRKTAERVTFTVRGNGKTNVKLGIGSQVGYGHCCSGVSKDSYTSFTGEVGWVLYDSESRRVITKVYSELSGKTVDLRSYY
jgi:hypothetical protein